MSDEQEPAEPETKQPSVVTRLAGTIVPALATGGLVFAVVTFFPASAPQCSGGDDGSGHHADNIDPYDDVEFVSLEPLVVSLAGGADADYLRISISIETTSKDSKKIAYLTPKLRDVLNGYLRAVDESDLTEPLAMTKLRSQILRRVRVAATPYTIKNVLITDFILN